MQHARYQSNYTHIKTVYERHGSKEAVQPSKYISTDGSLYRTEDTYGFYTFFLINKGISCSNNFCSRLFMIPLFSYRVFVTICLRSTAICINRVQQHNTGALKGANFVEFLTKYKYNMP